MKLNTTAAPVIVSGGGATSQFSIAVNAKAFRVLSDTMYQNKIGSICRELCCNAKDSHVSANKHSVPFIVHIPDSYEPWFSVQDFGMGLSPDDIANVFTVYFQSTKDSSNETVGAFGLGAKTPFSYTDQFTVTSVYNGIRRIYSAFINESGLPTIVEMAESETTDGNGVEIKMSVKREDFQKFRNEVAQQLRFFKVKPTIQNCSGFTWPVLEKDFVIENSDVTIAKSGSGYGANKFFIIQGEVGYPLDVGQINGKITAENAELVNRLSSNQVCLFFNIGEIGVTASREGVEYNPETVKHIDAKLTTARKKLEDYITAQLANCKTTWEKVQFLNRGTICQLAQASGITLPNVKKSNGGNYFFDISSLIREERTRQATPTSTPVKYMAPIGDFKYWQRYKSSRLDASSDNFTPPENDAGIMFIVRDTANRPNVRAKYLFEGDAKLTTIYEFSTYDRENTDWDAFINKLSVLLGGYPVSKIVKLSDVELPAKIVDASGKVRATYTRPTHYCYTNTDITSVRSWDRNYDGLESVEDEVVYVTIKDMQPTMADPYTVFEHYNTMKRFMTVPALVAVREGDVDKIKDNDLFTELTVYVNRVIDHLKNDVKTRVKYRHSQVVAHINARFPHFIMLDSTLSAIRKEAPASAIGRVLNLAAKRTMTPVELAKAQNIANLVGWNKEVSRTVEEKAADFHAKMRERYPLVYVLNEWTVRNAVSADHLAKYLRVM